MKDPLVTGSLSNQGHIPPLDGANEWINSPALTTAALRGKVVLVDFWTFTCINWLRTLPYLRAWADAYEPHGLVVIGVHTPEFGFEHEVDEVRRSAKDLGVEYPIAIDNDYAVWRAFANHYWPALYLVDAQGVIRHHEFGEGEYERSERIIQQLLADAGGRDVPRDLVAVEPRAIEVAAAWDDLQTAETYVGYERTERFASTGDLRMDAPTTFAVPDQLPANTWALGGAWTLGREAATLHEAAGRIAYRFHARDLHLILRPTAHDAIVRFRVLIDGRPPRAAHGGDVDEDGNGTVREPRLYQLIRQPPPIADRTFEIEFLDADVEAFAFTFG
jgi:thiol-disulfide isomerase/thioredoxin